MRVSRLVLGAVALCLVGVCVLSGCSKQREARIPEAPEVLQKSAESMGQANSFGFSLETTGGFAPLSGGMAIG